MGKVIDEGTGLGVEASSSSETVADRVLMLYSAEAMSEADSLTSWFGSRIKAIALEIAKRDGRRTVTREDIRSAYEALDAEDFNSFDEDADGTESTEGPTSESSPSYDKSKRRPRKPPEPKAQFLQTTTDGAKTKGQVQDKLIEMVNAAALTEANRRRATAIDATDYEKAFDLIAGPAKRENAVAIIADVATAVGTGMIGYAINVYIGPTPEMRHGHLAMLGGTALLAIGIVLKYFMHWK